MMPHFIASASASAFVALTLALATTHAAEEPNLKFFRDLAETRNYTLGRPVSPKLINDGYGTEYVLYLRGGPRDPVLRLYEFRLPNGPERELLTPAQLLGSGEEKLSAEEKARRERARVNTRGFTKFDVSQNGTRLLVTLSGQLYVVNRADLKVTALPGKNWIDPRLSPDGWAVSAVSGGELHIIELNTSPNRGMLSFGTGVIEPGVVAQKPDIIDYGPPFIPRPITSGATTTLSHGTAEFVAQEEMARAEGYWWSPDSKSLVYQETDESAVEVRSIADPLHPEVAPTKFFYPRAGSANAKVRLGIVSRAGGATKWITWDAAKFPYVTRVSWRHSMEPLTVQVMDRAQQNALLLRIDPDTGATTELIHETDPAWLNLDERGELPRWLPGKKRAEFVDEFIWTSESRGSWQVEVRAADGKFLRALTPPDFIYKSLLHVSSTDGIYVAGSYDPRETQIWRFPLDGGPGTAITTGFGQHSAKFFLNGGKTFVHTYDLFDGTSATEVLAADGKLLATLPSHAEKLPATANVELTRTAGDPSFYAAIVRPRDFNSAKKYPVILYVYAGPHSTVVSATARAYLNDQWMADQGYIVARLDGRGTPFRGRDWERSIRGNFIDLALTDQVAGLRALGAKYPEMDLTRVGVTGWSFGGYFSAMATIRRPDVFACGIAGAPVITWENYDTFYTERYLGLPQTDPAAYKVSSVLTYASELKRPLLLIHGLTDDNVYAQHTLQLCDALFMAGKPYEFMPMLGTHMAGSSDPLVKLRQQQRVMEFFARNLSSK